MRCQPPYASIYLHKRLILIYVYSSTLPPTVVQAEAVSIPEASAASDTTTSTTTNVTTNTAEGNEGNEGNGDKLCMLIRCQCF